MGSCDLRIGHNENLYYGGNIGYRVEEAYRGNHYAGKACLLLFELARKHDLQYLIITCNPDNAASRKTCEYAGENFWKSFRCRRIMTCGMRGKPKNAFTGLNCNTYIGIKYLRIPAFESQAERLIKK